MQAVSTVREPALLPGDAYVASTLLLLQTSLRRGERIRLPVTGYSMAPLLHPGDAVWVEQAEAALLRRGEIVLYCDGCLLTHRLVAVDQHGWHCKGDNNPQADAPVAAEAIQGRIVAIECESTFINIQRQPWLVVGRLLGWLGALETRITRPGSSSLRQSLHILFRSVARSLVAIALRCSTGRSC